MSEGFATGLDHGASRWRRWRAPLERNAGLFDGLEQSHIQLAEREIGFSTRSMGQDRAVFPDDAGKEISEAAQGQGLVPTPCDQEQHMAALAALCQCSFNFGRHGPVDGERPVEVEGHDATIHTASEG